MYVCMYVCLCVYVCMYVCMYVCISQSVSTILCEHGQACLQGLISIKCIGVESVNTHYAMTAKTHKYTHIHITHL